MRTAFVVFLSLLSGVGGLTAIATHTAAFAETFDEPVIHMQDTTRTTGQSIWAGRPVHAEYVGPSSVLVGKQMDTIIVTLKQSESPSGIAEIGIIDEDLSMKRVFATLDVSILTRSYTSYEFSSGSIPYTIEAGDRIGVKYLEGTRTSNISIMRDTDPADPFDGQNSYHTFYTTRWSERLLDDVTMTLKLVGASSEDGDGSSDIRCFQRTDGIVFEQDGWYIVVIYEELQMEMCDDENSSDVGMPIKVDMSDAGPDYLDESGATYTEYRLLDGTILSFGNKNIMYANGEDNGNSSEDGSGFAGIEEDGNQSNDSGLGGMVSEDETNAGDGGSGEGQSTNSVEDSNANSEDDVGNSTSGSVAESEENISQPTGGSSRNVYATFYKPIEDSLAPFAGAEIPELDEAGERPSNVYMHKTITYVEYVHYRELIARNVFGLGGLNQLQQAWLFYQIEPVINPAFAWLDD